MKLPQRESCLAYVTRGSFQGRAVTLKRLANEATCEQMGLESPCWIIQCATPLSGKTSEGRTFSSRTGIVRANALAIIAGPEFNWLPNVKEEKKP